MASKRLEFHQVRTRVCFGEKYISVLPIEVTGGMVKGLIKHPGLITVAGFQEFAKGLEGADTVGEFDFDAAVRDTDFGDSGEVEVRGVNFLGMECEFHGIVGPTEGQLSQSPDGVFSAKLSGSIAAHFIQTSADIFLSQLSESLTRAAGIKGSAFRVHRAKEGGAEGIVKFSQRHGINPFEGTYKHSLPRKESCTQECNQNKKNLKKIKKAKKAACPFPEQAAGIYT